MIELRNVFALMFLLIAQIVVIQVAEAQTNAQAAISPAHFAYSARLTDAENSIREVIIPEQVMVNIRRLDLGDVRVFNAQGQTVPHEFVAPQVIDKSSQKELVFYPFNQQQAADPARIRIKIMQNKGQQSIDIQNDMGAGTQPPASLREYQYIIENSRKDEKLCGLKLSWQQPKSSLIIPLKLEASNDMQQWSMLTNTANISQLDYAGSQLLNSEVKFSCSTEKYLRLTWLKPEQNIHLKDIFATYLQAGSMPFQHVNLGKPKLDKNNEWQFESRSYAPISRISFIMKNDGVLYKGRLYSRLNEHENWRVQADFTQYRLKLGNSRLESSAISISAIKHKYWKIKLVGDTIFDATQLPEIKLSWRQQKLVFLAQGKAPYTLAYGNADVAVSENGGIHALLQTLRDSGGEADRVTLKTPIANAQIVKPSKDFAWKIFGFWMLLLLGTAVLGYMAFSLYQQMNSEVEKN